MINLCNRTEYSFKTAYGRIEDVLDTKQGDAAGICDRHGTWGHVQWKKACDKKGIKPIYGVELAFVENMYEREKQSVHWVRFTAKNNDGLKEMYELVTLATENFYYHPRLDWSVLCDISKNLFIIIGENAPIETNSKVKDQHVYIAVDATTQKHSTNKNTVAISDNYYPSPEDKAAFQIVAGKFAESRTAPMHILNEWELENELDFDFSDALANIYKIAEQCNVDLPVAEMVKPVVDKTLREMCEAGAIDKKFVLNDEVYSKRLTRELDLIAEKDFEDYFFVVADMVQYAKQHMLVGPARGSSAGSLVCYLLDITEIDPIKYDLLFERFIDINRMDYPDIDIDFPDNKRDMIFDYLKKKYGSSSVSKLGSISKFKPKSAIDEVSRAVNIPRWKLEDFKGSIIDRPAGDDRSDQCIHDTITETKEGQRTLEQFPEIEVAALIEGHSRHTGQHAAAIIVTNDPVHNYCSVDEQTGAAMIDKHDAEDLNLLKIDALGLRTLTVIEDCLDQIGLSYKALLDWPTDDEKAFDLINAGKFSGIFQFEGYALQGLCRNMEIKEFEDMVAITALARPGPLNSGGAAEYIERHSGKSEVEYLTPLMEDITKITYGVIVYQEQVMQIVRKVGNLSWAETSKVRKAIAKSLGEEKLNKNWVQFKKGAKENGISEAIAKNIWSNITTMGSYAFNRSHAVAYGLISYWCAVLKARFPLEYAAASLRHAKDEDQSIQILRELDSEGYKYKAFDKEKSVLNWSVQDGVLVGGLLGVKGIGPKMGPDIMARRAEGREFTKRHHSLMDAPITPYDTIFEGRDLWSHVFDDPIKYKIATGLTKLDDISDKRNKIIVFIAKISEKGLRDHNEQVNRDKRGGGYMKGQTLYLNLTLSDDTGQIIGRISKRDYLKWGVPIMNEGEVGDWYIFKAKIVKGFRMAFIARWKKLTDNDEYKLGEE